jgi:hypothetical protein
MYDLMSTHPEKSCSLNKIFQKYPSREALPQKYKNVHTLLVFENVFFSSFGIILIHRPSDSCVSEDAGTKSTTEVTEQILCDNTSNTHLSVQLNESRMIGFTVSVC